MFRVALRRTLTTTAARRNAALHTPASPLDAIRQNIHQRINGSVNGSSPEGRSRVQPQMPKPAEVSSGADEESHNPYFDFLDEMDKEDEAAQEAARAQGPKVPHPSPNFYTTRPVFYDQVAQLERAIAMASTALRRAQLLPLPAFARASLPPAHSVWKTQEDMASDFKAKMTLVRYRKVTKLLNELNTYYRIADTAGATDIAQKIYAITSMFESPSKEAYLARFKRKQVPLDEYGRSFTFGRRKTSSARVWMIPVQESAAGASSSSTIPTSTILVNNLPLHEYFALSGDREKITRPLRVAGVLGKYNIFTIVRGGGTTGQAGAIAHGIAKGLLAHEPDLETLFRKSTFCADFHWVSIINRLLYSETQPSRSSYGRTKEDWSGQGSQEGM